MMMRTVLPALMAAAFAASAFAPVQARPVAAEDLFKMSYVSGVQISPDGKNVAFVVSTLNGPQNRYDNNLWLVNAATSKARRLTNDGRDANPVWAPNSSRFVFVRGAAKARPQIYLYDVASGRTSKLTNLKGGANSPVFSNSGKLIAFTGTAMDAPADAQIDFRAAGFVPKKSQRKSDVSQIDTIHYRANGAGEIYRFHRHIWVMNADGSHQRALTQGDQWSEAGPSWSPNDATIAFNSLRRDTPNLGESDIYTISSAGGPMRALRSAELANDGPVFGNTSSRLWYFTGGIDDPAEYEALVSSNPDGSDRRELIAKNAVNFGDASLTDTKEGGGSCWQFSPDDSYAVTSMNGPGYVDIVLVNLRSGAITKITGSNGEAYDCSASRDAKTIAYAFSDFTHPAEVYVVSTQGGVPRRLTALNDAYVNSVSFSNPTPVVVKDRAGFDVHAWFMPAVGSKARGARPTLLDIHGGPQTQFANTFFHELQYWAGQGYNVVFADPRGSVGFGYPFQEALAKDWGNAMFEDEMAVMDEVAKRPDVDVNRLGVLGGSYGGYATLWVISHTDRFKTAIAERVVSNLMTEQTVADLASENALGGKYSWGNPWDPGNKLAEQSPITYVTRVHTPLLILHSTQDIRTPEDQTLQEFTSLKILGRTVHYVEFPGENHDLSRTGGPIHRVERLHILNDWLNRYLHP